MCTCASCEHTDSAKVWPARGEAKGLAKSRREYSEHVSHGQRWGDWFNPSTERFEPRIREVPDFTIKPDPVYPVTGTRGCHPVEPMPAWWYAWNARNARALKSKGPDEPAPARPAQPGKAAQHLPELNRQPEPTAKIYAMPKAKPKQEAKRPRGRPAIDGRRVVIKLEERQIKAAEKLGGGNVAAGIRAALARTG